MPNGTRTKDLDFDLYQLYSFRLKYVAKTANYTATADDEIIDCTSGTFTITLPAAANYAGKTYHIKNSGAGVITVDGNGAETIDGLATQTIAAGSSMMIAGTGTAWIII